MHALAIFNSFEWVKVFLHNGRFNLWHPGLSGKIMRFERGSSHWSDITFWMVSVCWLTVESGSVINRAGAGLGVTRVNPLALLQWLQTIGTLTLTLSTSDLRWEGFRAHTSALLWRPGVWGRWGRYAAACGLCSIHFLSTQPFSFSYFHSCCAR